MVWVVVAGVIEMADAGNRVEEGHIGNVEVRNPTDLSVDYCCGF